MHRFIATRAIAARALGVGATLAILAVTALVGPQPAGAAPQSPPPKAYVLVDADSGVVLEGENIHTAVRPASTAKIMTALTASERMPIGATITVSELAASQPPSKITMAAGQEWRFEDALASLMMVSANDAAYAVAEAAGGTLEGFAAAMTATANRFGMRDSTFSDPAGFDDEASFRGGPRMSAFDIAIATRNALGVPDIARFAALRDYAFTDPAGTQRALTNHNKMLPGSSREYAGATGFKTGFTNQAGHTLVATATRDGRTMIAVIVDTYDTYGWAAALLDQGFTTPPNAQGTGEKLPEPATSSYSQREADRRGFVVLARGGSIVDLAQQPTTTTPTTTTATTSGAGVPGSSVAPPTTATSPESNDSTAAAPERASGRESSEGGGILTVRNTITVVLVLLAAVVVLRRRAVVRRRRKRRARSRAMAAAMRGGSLPVVDGRYRTGTRTGPPVESHVRVHRK